MKFAADPMTLAVALGLLGPAALDEQGVLDDGGADSDVDIISPLKELVQDEGQELLEELVQEWELPPTLPSHTAPEFGEV